MSVKVGGDWKEQEIWRKIGGTWHQVGQGWQKSGGVWRSIHEANIPAGIIIPYDGAVAPGGWALYTAPNGKVITGWGVGNAPGTSQANSGNITVTTSSDGAHTGTGVNKGYYTSIGTWNKNSSQANHSHSFVFNPGGPPKRDLVFIQSQMPLMRFPKNGIALFQSAPSGLTDVYDEARFLAANSSVGTGGYSSKADTSDAPGTHKHGDTAVYSTSVYMIPNAAGNHTHNETFVFSWDFLRYGLGAYTDLVSSYPLLAGHIAMWEDVVAPAGWGLCDGTGGRPDLQDRFIDLNKTDMDVATSPVDKTFSTSGTTPSDGVHNHGNTLSLSYAVGSLYHPGNAGGWSHTYSKSANWYPDRYRLAFIMPL
jgi:hypothetical protein